MKKILNFFLKKKNNKKEKKSFLELLIKVNNRIKRLEKENIKITNSLYNIEIEFQKKLDDLVLKIYKDMDKK